MIPAETVIASLRPDCPFVMYAADISTIEWHVENVTPVTQAEFDAELQRLAQAAADQAAADAAARDAAIAHAKSLGFTDEMIAVMYPALNTPAV